jgi:molybdopterin/thiamine biosynthesis adenylyltransferase
LCDNDTVDFSNLQRQIIHRTATVGQPKVLSAQATLHEINPEVECVPLQIRADEAKLMELIAQADVVLDCSDNFPTRYAINRACLAQRKPLVSGAAILTNGQISVFDFRRDNSPCYNCLFSEDSEAEELHCATTGVFAPLVGMIGTMQAAEAIKLLIGLEGGLSGKLLFVDALEMNFIRSDLCKDPTCRVCGPSPAGQKIEMGASAFLPSLK